MAAATCPPVFDWAKNTDNNDSCELASQLITLCNYPGQPEFHLPALPSGSVYPLPDHHEGTANSCTCSSDVYALVSVCSACQNASFNSWSNWTSSCENRDSIGFPVETEIPIPQWVNFDVQSEPTFDVTRARNSVINSLPTSPNSPNVTDTPSTPAANFTSSIDVSALGTTSTSSSALTTQTSSILYSSSSVHHSSDTSSSSDGQTTSTDAPILATQASGADPAAVTGKDQSNSASTPSSATSTNKGSNTGAIAGGTVAGIIVLLLLGGLLFWWIRRHRRSRMAPSAAYMAAYGTARPPTMVSQRGVSPFLTTKAHPNFPYHDEDLRSSAYSDSRQPLDRY